MKELQVAMRCSTYFWAPSQGSLIEGSGCKSALLQANEPLFAVEDRGQTALARGGSLSLSFSPDSRKVLGLIPSFSPDQLGDPGFRLVHKTRYNYVAGAMANAIASEELVIAMAKNGMLGFFGAGGLHPQRVENAIEKIQSEVADLPYGFNLLHNPFEPSIEQRTVELYLKKGVRIAEAAAYMGLTPWVVLYRVKGLKKDQNGMALPMNQIFAKVSRSEVARVFMAPPPEKILEDLLSKGLITQSERELAREIPMAEDITAEADSGGHTDRRPLVTMLPTFLALRDQAMSVHKYSRKIRIGAAGGIATPASVAAAFFMGADYVVTGSVNQACVESGTSDYVRKILCDIEPHDVAMAPASDMFEMGVDLQVMKKGTLFSVRAKKLYECYRQYASIEEIPLAQRQTLEKQIFLKNLDLVWQDCVEFFNQRDPSQVQKAMKDSKHKMALIFRWYLGKSSIWAIQGVEERKMDYQIWVGPAMGAFNEWTRNTWLFEPKNRKASVVAINLLQGACVQMRICEFTRLGGKLSFEDLRILPDQTLKA